MASRVTMSSLCMLCPQPSSLHALAHLVPSAGFHVLLKHSQHPSVMTNVRQTQGSIAVLCVCMCVWVCARVMCVCVCVFIIK